MASKAAGKHLYRLPSAPSVSAEWLAAHGYTAVILDIDNTIVSRADGNYVAGLEAWLAKLQAAGVRVCLLSNNWHASVFDHRDHLGLPLVRKAMKPLPFAFFKARHLLGAPRAHCLVIGDQLITDVLGARLSGLDAVWVDPLSTTDLWYTRIFRRFEAFYLCHHRF